jgi:asparagine N-glycosylation enzyme membrane subunit Stt3
MYSYGFSGVDPVAFLITLVIWGLIWWGWFSKMGYRGNTRWFLVIGSLFPPTLAIELLVLGCITWPVCKELKQLKKQGKNFTR